MTAVGRGSVGVSLRSAVGAAWCVLVACGDPLSEPSAPAPDPPEEDPADPAPSDESPPPTTIRVHYPAGARSLTLRGSPPLSWDRGAPLTGADDVWTWSSQDVSTELEWKPLLDDQTWSLGPAFRVGPGEAVDVWPRFTSTQGQVVELIAKFESHDLPDDRAIWAYLPPTYAENAKARFPVLYMTDGQDLFDANRAFGGVEWRVDETLDAGAADGSIRETIVIAIDQTASRIYEYTPTDDDTIGDGGGGDRFLTMVADELKPVVDGMLRTHAGPHDTAILGSSLGGLLAAYASTTRATVFDRAGAMSPSTWWDDRVIVDLVSAMGPVRPARIYVDSGDSGSSRDSVDDTTLLASAYRTIGYVDGVNFRHVVQAGGQHNATYWAQRLPDALQFLLGPRP